MNNRPLQSTNLDEENCLSDEMAEVLRQKTDRERLQIGIEMWRAANCMIQATVKQEHPEWSAEEIQREVARRLSHGSI